MIDQKPKAFTWKAHYKYSLLCLKTNNDNRIVGSQHSNSWGEKKKGIASFYLQNIQ